ncbi:iron-containing alcohol dehydrogenase [Paenibacillus arenilitoris]|uniref:Iron-containing alcohol dehydrogenase n=1 Tax=Paenibacillus arenilitoris TaxID=2772299 RepID=A0A927CRL0_9BACL|nr:iron-containing alcohol dehydrogenase [Paenibacillus arenilitoris]MBD2870936.1 iron-containing alcohol dehydrogenase [Paenibacillus arenilitoris]
MRGHVETVYGKIEEQLSRLGDYIVVTTDPAWRLCEPRFRSKPPREVVEIDSLDEDYLNGVYARRLEKEASGKPIIVGVGGGTVLDAAKYFAYRQGTVPVLIPSITSTNAPFTDFISIRRGGGPFGFKVDGYPKKIVVDAALIQMADPRFNRAGYGDLLYMQTTLNDWVISSRSGIGEPLLPEIAGQITGIVNAAIAGASDIGAITEAGIRALMENTRISSELYMANLRLPIGSGSEHLFSWNLELVTKKHLIHGETVALGIVIASFLQARHMADSRHIELRRALDEARVMYEPDRIGVAWEEIERTLRTVEAYNRDVRRFHTVFGKTEWTDDLLQGVRTYIYGEG